MSVNNGGPAFPVAYGGSSKDGLRMRDYFAAKALQGMLADPGLIGNTEQVAQVAYRYADAMLKAREVQQ
jgi:hypothetical protein